MVPVMLAELGRRPFFAGGGGFCYMNVGTSLNSGPGRDPRTMRHARIMGKILKTIKNIISNFQ